MWTSKPLQSDVPSASPAPHSPQTQQRALQPPGAAAPRSAAPAAPVARPPAWLGPGLTVKGQISGNEDLQIEGKVEGQITIGGHRLIIGHKAETTEEVIAREVIVHGKVRGDLRAADRIEIKRDASVTGDLVTARLVIEDGAYFKGHIEITRGKAPVGTDLDGLLARTTPGSD